MQSDGAIMRPVQGTNRVVSIEEKIVQSGETPSCFTQRVDTPEEPTHFHHPSSPNLSPNQSGIPMTVIVHAPTVFIHAFFTDQHYPQSSSTPPIEIFDKSLERSLLLCLIWLATQFSYIFNSSISNYFGRDVVNMWIRWPEVIVIVYIAARFLRDAHLQNTAAIRLPPDREAGGSFATDLSLGDAP
ncbi:hypothetical protein BDN70DRAFT_890635 [Pholiota conissans]|uniref:Uncharacterized protein n=1 Tax=Pholiota conissans TaxID=109636 RepID=A0A9P5ZC80_9AGAR|nr:hypothetical protein BDN70DRAFT_890635 [Pholiota conissans]